MRAICLQHVPFEGPAYIRDVCENRGISLDPLPLYEGASFPGQDDFDLLFIMGGPMGVHDARHFDWMDPEKRFIELSLKKGKPVVGICLGAQLLADVLGARVYRNRTPEVGWFPVSRTVKREETGVISAFPDRFHALHLHGDTFDLPAGSIHLARSEACENQAFICGTRTLGLQFHIESTPGSLEEFIRGAGDFPPAGEWVQGPGELRRGNHYGEIHGILAKVIAGLIDGRE